MVFGLIGRHLRGLSLIYVYLLLQPCYHGILHVDHSVSLLSYKLCIVHRYILESLACDKNIALKKFYGKVAESDLKYLHTFRTFS